MEGQPKGSPHSLDVGKARNQPAGIRRHPQPEAACTTSNPHPCSGRCGSPSSAESYWQGRLWEAAADPREVPGSLSSPSLLLSPPGGGITCGERRASQPGLLRPLSGPRLPPRLPPPLTAARLPGARPGSSRPSGATGPLTSFPGPHLSSLGSLLPAFSFLFLLRPLVWLLLAHTPKPLPSAPPPPP